jgi:hypothetical protein
MKTSVFCACLCAGGGLLDLSVYCRCVGAVLTTRSLRGGNRGHAYVRDGYCYIGLGEENKVHMG